MRISSAKNTHGNVSQGKVVINVTLSFQDSIGAIATAILASVILFEAFLFNRDVLSDPCSCRNNSTQTSLDAEYPHASALSQNSEVLPVNRLKSSNAYQQYIEQTEFLVQDFAKFVNGMPRTRTLFGLFSPPHEVTLLTKRPNEQSFLTLGPLSISWSIPVSSSEESSSNEMGQLTAQVSNSFNLNSINSLSQARPRTLVGSRQPIPFDFERLPSSAEKNLVLPSKAPVPGQPPVEQTNPLYSEPVSPLITKNPTLVNRSGARVPSFPEGELTEVPSISLVIPIESAEEASKIFEPRGVIGSALATIIGLLVIAARKKDK